MVPSTGYPYWMFQAFSRQNGQDLMNPEGNRTNFTHPDVVNALQYWVDLGRKHRRDARRHRRVGDAAAELHRGQDRDDVAHHRQPHRGEGWRQVRVRRVDAASLQAARLAHRRRQLVSLQEVDARRAQGGVRVHQVDHRARARRRLEHRHRLRRGKPAAYDTPKLKSYVAGFPAAAVARDQFKFATPELSTFQTGRVRKSLDDAIQAALTGSKPPPRRSRPPRRKPKDSSNRTR